MLASAERPSAAGAFPTACFSVTTDSDPSALPRVLEVFALRALIPSQCHAVYVDDALVLEPNAELTIDIQIAGLEREDAELIARRLRSIVCVRGVLTSEKRRDRIALDRL
jgi:hypothetical protein